MNNCERCRWLDKEDGTGLLWCDANECYLPPIGLNSVDDICCKDFKAISDRGILNKKEKK